MACCFHYRTAGHELTHRSARLVVFSASRVEGRDSHMALRPRALVLPASHMAPRPRALVLPDSHMAPWPLPLVLRPPTRHFGRGLSCCQPPTWHFGRGPSCCQPTTWHPGRGASCCHAASDIAPRPWSASCCRPPTWHLVFLDRGCLVPPASHTAPRPRASRIPSLPH